MSDAVVTPVAAPVTLDPQGSAAVTSAANNGLPEDQKPSWLDARLERERKSVLKDLGVDSVDDAKKALAELNAKRESEKSSAQKAAELEATLKSEKASKAEMVEALSAFAKNQLASLTEAQRNAVAAVAGDDPAKQLKTIAALAPTWAQQAAPAAATATPVVPKDTATAPSAPKEAGNVSPPDPKAIYEELVKTNPIIAARYAINNGLFDK